MKTAALAILLTLGLLSATASACPNCRESVETPTQLELEPSRTASTLSGGFNSAIWAMLAGLAGGIGLIGTTIALAAQGTHKTRE